MPGEIEGCGRGQDRDRLSRQRRPGLPRIHSVHLLIDADTLASVALIDGLALTSLRTPAMPAIAVKHLAAPDASRLVVAGGGPQAAGHIEAVRAVRPVTDVVVGRDPWRTARFVANVASAGGQVVEDAATALPGRRRLHGDHRSGPGPGRPGDGRRPGQRRTAGHEGVPTIFKSVGMAWQDLVAATLIGRRRTDVDKPGTKHRLAIATNHGQLITLDRSGVSGLCRSGRDQWPFVRSPEWVYILLGRGHLPFLSWPRPYAGEQGEI